MSLPTTYLVPCPSSCICQTLRQTFLFQRREVHSFMIRTSNFWWCKNELETKRLNRFCKGKVYYKKVISVVFFRIPFVVCKINLNHMNKKKSNRGGGHYYIDHLILGLYIEKILVFISWNRNPDLVTNSTRNPFSQMNLKWNDFTQLKFPIHPG